jgi:uncharacterized protein YpbB
VGETKLKELGDEFIEAISEYASANELAERSNPRDGKQRAAARPRSSGKRSQRSSHAETRRLFNDGLGIDEIAEERRLSPKRVCQHLIEMAQSDPPLDLSSLMPAPDRAETIKAAIRMAKGSRLAPIKRSLGDDYSYEEIRLVKLSIENASGPLFEPEG